MTKKKILNEIHKNIENFYSYKSDHSFDLENPRVRLHEPTFAADEINSVLDVLLSSYVTMGKKVSNFEREFSKANNFNHGVMNNSGSSANLLAIAALTNPDFVDHMSPGDEVIVPALSWSTTVWPLIQHGLVPVIVDIDIETLNINIDEIEKAIGPKTRAIMPVHVYGNPCDMEKLSSICKRHNLFLIEDCCEALGAEFDSKPVGSFGDLGTFSFYFSHHMTTLEGGITVTNNFELSELMRILRAHGWIREVEDKEKYSRMYPDIDPRFLFVNLGYNLRPTEIQGAMGSIQLPKLPGYVEKRRENTFFFNAHLKQYKKYFDFQIEQSNALSSCFGYPLIIKNDAPFSVSDITKFLNTQGIETRPIICGNIAKQPAIKKFKHRVVGDLQNSSRVMKNGFSFGNHQALTDEAKLYLTNKIDEFIDLT